MMCKDRDDPLTYKENRRKEFGEGPNDVERKKIIIKVVQITTDDAKYHQVIKQSASSNPMLECWGGV